MKFSGNRVKIGIVLAIIAGLETKLFSAKDTSSFLSRVTEMWTGKKTETAVASTKPVAQEKPIISNTTNTPEKPAIPQKKEPTSDQKKELLTKKIENIIAGPGGKKVTMAKAKIMPVALATQKKAKAKTEAKKVTEQLKKNKVSFAEEFEKCRKLIAALLQQAGPNKNPQVMIKETEKILEKHPHVKESIKKVDEFIKAYGAFIEIDNADIKALRALLNENRTIFYKQNTFFEKAASRKNTSTPAAKAPQNSVVVGGRAFSKNDIDRIKDPHLRDLLIKRAAKQGIKLDEKKEPLVITEASQIATLQELLSASKNKKPLGNFMQRLGDASLSPQKSKGYVDQLTKILPSNDANKLLAWQKGPQGKNLIKKPEPKGKKAAITSLTKKDTSAKK